MDDRRFRQLGRVKGVEVVLVVGPRSKDKDGTGADRSGRTPTKFRRRFLKESIVFFLLSNGKKKNVRCFVHQRQ